MVNAYNVICTTIGNVIYKNISNIKRYSFCTYVYDTGYIVYM